MNQHAELQLVPTGSFDVRVKVKAKVKARSKSRAETDNVDCEFDRDC